MSLLSIIPFQNSFIDLFSNKFSLILLLEVDFSSFAFSAFFRWNFSFSLNIFTWNALVEMQLLMIYITFSLREFVRSVARFSMSQFARKYMNSELLNGVYFWTLLYHLSSWNCPFASLNCLLLLYSSRFFFPFRFDSLN